MAAFYLSNVLISDGICAFWGEIECKTIRCLICPHSTFISTDNDIISFEMIEFNTLFGQLSLNKPRSLLYIGNPNFGAKLNNKDAIIHGVYIRTMVRH